MDEPKWIPVTERLPEESGAYLTSIHDDRCPFVIENRWSESRGWSFERKGVTAWMPLPEPYKPEKTEV